MTTTEATPCAAEQRAEWDDLHSRMRDLTTQYHEALEDAGGWIAWSLDRGNEEFALSKAREAAGRANSLWAERTALHQQVAAHPFTAELYARREERAS